MAASALPIRLMELAETGEWDEDAIKTAARRIAFLERTLQQICALKTLRVSAGEVTSADRAEMAFDLAEAALDPEARRKRLLAEQARSLGHKYPHLKKDLPNA